MGSGVLKLDGENTDVVLTTSEILLKFSWISFKITFGKKVLSLQSFFFTGN